MSFDAILAALEQHGCKPRRAGKGWIAYCPVHEADGRRHTPSLSVDEGEDGRTLLYCHAGCSTESIIRALGLTMADLMSSDTSPPQHGTAPPPHNREQHATTYPTADAAIAHLRRKFGRKETHRWAYHNRLGNIVMYVLRWDIDGRKQYRPISRLPNNSWQIAALQRSWPLYQLPQVLAADPREPIFVVEGEKCADALAAIGLIATTSAGGAQAAHKTNWMPLSGRLVIILPDNDDAGERYAETVASLLVHTADTHPRILRLAEHASRLPVGGDVADILAADDWCGLLLGDAATTEMFQSYLYALADIAPEWERIINGKQDRQ